MPLPATGRVVVLLCGPPGAGKTTAAVASGLDVYDRDDPRWRDDRTFRAAIASLAHDPNVRAVVIRSGATSTARAKNATLIGATHMWLLTAPRAELNRRVSSRARHDNRACHVGISRWFTRHDRHDQVPDFPGWEHTGPPQPDHHPHHDRHPRHHRRAPPTNTTPHPRRPHPGGAARTGQPHRPTLVPHQGPGHPPRRRHLPPLRPTRRRHRRPHHPRLPRRSHLRHAQPRRRPPTVQPDPWRPTRRRGPRRAHRTRRHHQRPHLDLVTSTSTATHLCRVCGTELDLFTGRRGRPSTYCSATCRDRWHASRRCAKRPAAFVCVGCGAIFRQPDGRGSWPKWCPDCRRRNLRQTSCRTCGQTFTARGASQYCSEGCRPGAWSHAKGPRQLTLPLPSDTRSALRRALDADDPAAVLRAIRRDVIVDERNCWIWQRRSNDGYPVVRLGRRSVQVHRLSLEAKHRAPLGSQAAHHMCAETMCVNPDHLQPVTHRDNVAEMLARTAYRSRIAELEEALADLQSDHPLLHRIRTR